MALTSPGVEVKVVDESFYTPAEPGTVPLIVVASAENKTNGAGDGTAPGTLKANAGQVYLITSQKDLVDTFGDPSFKTDSNNNPIHAGEQNEYGLQAAYSLLGVSNRAYVVRANIDLDELNASAEAPIANPIPGTHWLDTSVTAFGVFEWNGAAVTSSGGQTFTNKIPLVVTDPNKVDPLTGAPNTKAGGQIGDYAFVAVRDANDNRPALTSLHPNTLYYKNRSGAWVLVGSNQWQASWPTVAGTKAASTLTANNVIEINGESILVPVGPNNTLAKLVDAINANPILGGSGVTASVVNNKLEIYHNGESGDVGDDSNLVEIGAASTAGLLTTLGIAGGDYYNPRLTISKHTQVPTFKRKDTYPRPTGSVWLKTTESNLGARWRFKRWNGQTLLWDSITAPLYSNGHEAIASLDKTGGGANIALGTVYVQYNYQEHDDTADSTPRVAEFKAWRRAAIGATVVRSAKIITGMFTSGEDYVFNMAESLVGDAVIDADKVNQFTAAGDSSDAETIATVINANGYVNITAEVDSQNRLVIKHNKGGEIRFTNGLNTPLNPLGFSTAYQYEPSEANFGEGTEWIQTAPVGQTASGYVASNWVPLVYISSADNPGSLAEDGTLWYSSVVDEVDIMIHDGDKWVGYKSPTSPYFAEGTDPAGPMVAATAPEKQSDGSALETGDLWIDTSDIENYPTIYKYDSDLLNKPVKDRWVLVDKTDQSTDEGILFADARQGTDGGTADNAPTGTIEELLTSNFVDFDCPDPALYPKGMLLWNLRRSGFNVKKFKQSYIDTTADNTRFNAPVGESMQAYYTHRWVTESANNPDGSGSFGRQAQRKVVVQALQALVNSNQQIRDEESRVFNLMACPGYPELIGELISLNYDRGLTAFVVGDTPARLTPDATSLNRWGTNQRLALEDNDLGAVSYDEYMAMFYPWGFTSDNFGNNVVVPPSHMMLRTIALNDQVAYPWFAPAGLRRGGITNATAVGYVDAEGEFRSVALNNGQRDTLYESKINPITFFTGSGLVNYGQRTRAKAASALDRINVARLVIYLRRQLNALAKPYVFEPNDKITRDEIKGAVDSLMLELVGQRALYDYLVVCDESNNTPARIDRNELWVDVAVEPVKAVEFIYIPLRLKNTGEIAGL